jgi:succinyl-CoA synthetase beta subunit
VTQPEYAVILVRSTSHAMRVERLLRGQGIVCKMIPVPRPISSDCGVCIRVAQQDVEAARRAIEAGGVEIEAVHPA